MKQLVLTFALAACMAGNALAQGSGLGVNVPLVGRLVGGGNTLFITAVDVTNHSTRPITLDFYLDGSSAGNVLVLNGSINASGQLVARGAGGQVRARSNAHFDDFVDALIQANLLPAEVRTNGFLGSVLFVFGGLERSGEGSATARFYNSFGGGFVGVSLKGKEITASEPQSLVAAIQDTRGNTSGAPQIYPNMFINNTGLTPTGIGVAGAVTVEISAVGNSSGQPVGVPMTMQLGPGQTGSIGQVLNALQVPAGSENTILVFARVISGNAAIHGIISQVDNTTRDGAVFEMSRADF